VILKSAVDVDWHEGRAVDIFLLGGMR